MNEDRGAGILYIVATPIGNLEDITFRAVRILKEVDIVLAEDTRVTSRLLDHYEISYFAQAEMSAQGGERLLVSYHQHSSDQRKLEILSNIISGKDIALVTDAGTPGISDPGNELISFLLEKEPNIKIVPIPGPSAIVTALSVCGMNINKFVFLGFFPKKKRSKLFEWLRAGRLAFAFYESPNRIVKTLELVKGEFDDPDIFVGRELTKKFESIYRGKAEQIASDIMKDKIKGEIVVIVSYH